MTKMEHDRSPIGISAAGSRNDLKMLARWISLGACAGGLGGFLVGGVGGRLAMLLLRFTTETSIKGIESDDGFTMGRFDGSSTFSLLMLCTILGSVGGLIVVFGRPFFPRRYTMVGWPIAAGAIVGATIVKDDGVDFNLLEPVGLAVAMFIAIPAAGRSASSGSSNTGKRGGGSTGRELWWRPWPGCPRSCSFHWESWPQSLRPSGSSYCGSSLSGRYTNCVPFGCSPLPSSAR